VTPEAAAGEDDAPEAAATDDAGASSFGDATEAPSVKAVLQPAGSATLPPRYQKPPKKKMTPPQRTIVGWTPRAFRNAAPESPESPDVPESSDAPESPDNAPVAETAPAAEATPAAAQAAAAGDAAGAGEDDAPEAAATDDDGAFDATAAYGVDASSEGNNTEPPASPKPPAPSERLHQGIKPTPQPGPPTIGAAADGAAAAAAAEPESPVPSDDAPAVSAAPAAAQAVEAADGDDDAAFPEPPALPEAPPPPVLTGRKKSQASQEELKRQELKRLCWKFEELGDNRGKKKAYISSGGVVFSNLDKAFAIKEDTLALKALKVKQLAAALRNGLRPGWGVFELDRDRQQGATRNRMRNKIYISPTGKVYATKAALPPDASVPNAA